MMDKKIFMIKDSQTGLFSTGGTTPRFTKRGKVWSSSGALKNHLHIFETTIYRDDFDKWLLGDVSRNIRRALEVFSESQLIEIFKNFSGRKIVFSVVPENWTVIELNVGNPALNKEYPAREVNGEYKTI